MQSTNGEPNKEGAKQSGLSWSTPQNNQQHKPAAPAASPLKPMASAPAAAGTSSMGKYVGMIVVGVVAGVLVAWAWGAWRAPATNTAINTGTNTNTTNTSANTNTNTGTNTTGTAAGGTVGVGAGSDPSLTIMSPQKAGTSVAISKAIVSQPTWVVVYENKNGKPGNALGAALFFPEGQRGTVELLRATIAGQSYLVTRQTDNGDRKFSLRGDPILMEGGEALWVSFVAN